jgi:hypothetical protein
MPRAGVEAGIESWALEARSGGGWLPWRPSEVVMLVSTMVGRAARGGGWLTAWVVVAVVSAAVGRVAHGGGRLTAGGHSSSC